MLLWRAPSLIGRIEFIQVFFLFQTFFLFFPFPQIVELQQIFRKFLKGKTRFEIWMKDFRYHVETEDKVAKWNVGIKISHFDTKARKSQSTVCRLDKCPVNDKITY